MSELNSMYKRAEWAAKLILNPDSEVSIDFESADKVLVYHMDGRTSIAQTRTNEPLLLQALIKEICRKDRRDYKQERRKRMNKSAGIFDLPERLSREQANPFCHMLCKKGEECHGDCDCNVEVQTAWSEFLEIIKRQQWKGDE